MSKAEILRVLPQLGPADRREIFEAICRIDEHALLSGDETMKEERVLLDKELADYQDHPEVGSSWEEVRTRLQPPSR